MKIKYKYEPIIVKFGSLKQGDVFRTTCDETPYMKIEAGDYNYVCLRDGDGGYSEDTDEVVLLNATLVIE